MNQNKNLSSLLPSVPNIGNLELSDTDTVRRYETRFQAWMLMRRIRQSGGSMMLLGFFPLVLCWVGFLLQNV